MGARSGKNFKFMSGVDDEPEVIIISSENEVISRGELSFLRSLKKAVDSWNLQPTKLFMNQADYEDILKLDK